MPAGSSGRHQVGTGRRWPSSSTPSVRLAGRHRLRLLAELQPDAERRERPTGQQVDRRRRDVGREHGAAARQFKSVVLPACVPPETTMLSPAKTLACRKAALPPVPDFVDSGVDPRTRMLLVCPPQVLGKCRARPGGPLLRDPTEIDDEGSVALWTPDHVQQVRRSSSWQPTP